MLQPPIEPMLAAPMGHEVPDSAEGIVFEPKWDGFRCLVFRSPGGLVLQGRGRSRTDADGMVDLTYAFPELEAALLDQLPADTVLDGEIVIAHDGRLDFGLLTSRLRPRSEGEKANIQRLALQTPARFLAFDVLWSAGDLRDQPFAERAAALADLGASWRGSVSLTPSTQDVATARSWFTTFESSGIDGLMVKPLADPYQSGKRVQGKIKHQRTADVVVAGWRPHTKPGPAGQPVVGSLLLGLYDDDGVLQYVGGASAFTTKKRAELVDLLAPLTIGEVDAHPWRGDVRGRVPGEANRWKKEQPWIALAPEQVLEVTFDQMEHGRFRHVASFARWRPDRSPQSCTYAQIEPLPASAIEDLLG